MWKKGSNEAALMLSVKKNMNCVNVQMGIKNDQSSLN